MNDREVREMTELTATVIRNTAANTGFLSRCSFGERISTQAMKRIPKKIAEEVEMIVLVLRILLLFPVGKNLIMEKSKPKRERRMIRLRDDSRAVAIPTSSAEYSRAAIIQKRNPKPALVIEESIMKKEFL